jgi:hypothetical protein
MNTAKHTPGPWKVTINVNGIFVDAEDASIVEMQNSHMPDARLIAAAPALLAALREMVDHYVDCYGLDDLPDHVATARAAIAQAEQS